MINNRQGGGRRRGRGGGGGNGQRQGGQQGNGSRIDNRARGNASQLYEKYKNMAADAQRSGDRVNTEYYLQFADHYFRVLSEQRGRFEEGQQQRRPRDDFEFDGEDEFGDEGEPVRAREGWGEQPASEAPRADREDGRREQGRRDEGGREEGRREVRNDGRREWRDRPERQERADRNERRPVEGRPGEGRQGEGRADPVAERPSEPELVAGQRHAEPLAPGETIEARAAEVIDADRPLDPPAPRRRGRPRRDDAPAGEAAPAFEADRLPPALTVPANDSGPAGDEAKPRRRRLRAAGDEAPSAAE